MRLSRVAMACAVAAMMACAVAGIVVGWAATQRAARQGSVTQRVVPGGSTRASLRPAAPEAASPRPAIPTCRRSQLAVGGLGTSAATGTGIITIRVTNISPRSCSLQGRPAVTFLDAAGRALPVAESTMTLIHRAVVPLVPQTGSTTAGFVVTTADVLQPGEPCEAVAAVRIALPSVPGWFIVGGLGSPYDYSVCGRGFLFPAGVSPIAVAALIDEYAFPAFPACLASQLDASVAVQANSASGTRLVVTVTNHTTAICTIDGYPNASLMSSSGPAVLAYRAGRANALLPAPAFSQLVALGGGASASAALATAAPDARGSQCHAWSALSVALPGGSGTLRINRTLDICGAVPGAGAFVAGP
jgi:Protein of unknown function (DUF4232)